ncbi:Hypothetical predicted protein, partial [Podarcis lilfordi]
VARRQGLSGVLILGEGKEPSRSFEARPGEDLRTRGDHRSPQVPERAAEPDGLEDPASLSSSLLQLHFVIPISESGKLRGC